jgi:hypothetical protein
MMTTMFGVLAVAGVCAMAGGVAIRPTARSAVADVSSALSFMSYSMLQGLPTVQAT